MKKKDWEQLKIKPVAELEKSLSEHRERLWSLKADLVAGKIKNVNDIQKVKKLIARTLTIINQKHG